MNLGYDCFPLRLADIKRFLLVVYHILGKMFNITKTAHKEKKNYIYTFIYLCIATHCWAAKLTTVYTRKLFIGGDKSSAIWMIYLVIYVFTTYFPRLYLL